PRCPLYCSCGAPSWGASGKAKNAFGDNVSSDVRGAAVDCSSRREPESVLECPVDDSPVGTTNQLAGGPDEIQQMGCAVTQRVRTDNAAHWSGSRPGKFDRDGDLSDSFSHRRLRRHRISIVAESLRCP